MAMQPATWTINGLATELGIDRRTLAKRLADVPPAEIPERSQLPLLETQRKKESPRWRLRDVLAALGMLDGGSVQTSARPAPRAAEQVRAFEINLRTDPERVSWRDLAGLLEVNDDELAEWVRFGAPYLERGSLRTRKGWVFSPGHIFRWLGLWCSYLTERGLLPESSLRPGEATRALRVVEPATRARP